MTTDFDPTQLPKESQIKTNLNLAQEGSDRKITHEWAIQTHEGKTTHQVVVHDTTGKNYLLTYTFKGVQESDQLTQVLAMKALKNAFKSFTAKEAKEHFDRIKDKATAPEIYTIRGENKAVKAVILVWPGKEEGDPPYVWDANNKCKWELNTEGNFKEELLARFSGGVKEERSWRRLFLASTGQIGYIVNPKTETWLGKKLKDLFKVKRKGFHVVRQHSDGTPSSKRISKIDRAKDILAQIRFYSTPGGTLTRKPTTVDTGPIVGRITSVSPDPATTTTPTPPIPPLPPPEPPAPPRTSAPPPSTAPFPPSAVSSRISSMQREGAPISTAPLDSTHPNHVPTVSIKVVDESELNEQQKAQLRVEDEHLAATQHTANTAAVTFPFMYM
ncbi:MAG: hypothetical protein P4L16_07760 [Chlamydiales bacterium]|nr:hypothetical protein [Chlamydiales bacterium]